MACYYLTIQRTLFGPVNVVSISTSPSLTDLFSQIPGRQRITVMSFLQVVFMCHIFPGIWPKSHTDARQCQGKKRGLVPTPLGRSRAPPPNHSVLNNNNLSFPLIPPAAFHHLVYYLKYQTILSTYNSLNIWEFNCSVLLTTADSEQPVLSSADWSPGCCWPYTDNQPVKRN